MLTNHVKIFSPLLKQMIHSSTPGLQWLPRSGLMALLSQRGSWLSLGNKHRYVSFASRHVVLSVCSSYLNGCLSTVGWRVNDSDMKLHTTSSVNWVRISGRRQSCSFLKIIYIFWHLEQIKVSSCSIMLTETFLQPAYLNPNNSH